MPHVNVIGIGSSHGDDQAGWRVAESLAAEVEVYGPTVSIAVCGAPGSELPALLVACDIAIVVDALISGHNAPGTIYRYSDPAALCRADVRFSSHGLGLQTVFALAATLGDLPPELIVYGIEADSGMAADRISPAVDAAIGNVTASIRRDLAHYCGRQAPQ